MFTLPDATAFATASSFPATRSSLESPGAANAFVRCVTPLAKEAEEPSTIRAQALAREQAKLDRTLDDNVLSSEGEHDGEDEDIVSEIDVASKGGEEGSRTLKPVTEAAKRKGFAVKPRRVAMPVGRKPHAAKRRPIAKPPVKSNPRTQLMELDNSACLCSALLRLEIHGSFCDGCVA